MELEEELVFKRFPADKQEQVRSLVAYTQLMGLSGKDLVSIGGKLERLKATGEKKTNMATIHGMKIEHIGQDKNRRDTESALDERFKLRTVDAVYHIESNYGDRWEITNTSTKVKKRHNATNDYELGSVHWRRRQRYCLMLDIATGKLQLNF
jgi:hypothetical protein